MFFNNRINLGIIFCSVIILASCGYSFRGGGDLPKGIKSLSIKMLENRTSETGAENIFTNDLIYEITTQGKVVLTKEGSADGILSGVIQSMRIDAISHRDAYSSLERRVIVTLSLKLTDPTGKVIWSAKDIAESEDYIVASDKQTTERNRRQAIITLSKRLAEKVYNRLTENF
ncbi:MAG: LPS assembly lipoprotein LptE [Desulfobacterales bacterium]|nr:LPS assembly lipoprotein LptE [Desulfobacterales bacterium]